MCQAGEKAVGGIRLASRGCLGGSHQLRSGKRWDNTITAHFSKRDFDDLGDGVAVKNVGNSVADIDHDHAEAAVFFIRARAALIGVFASTADWGEAAVHQADELANADLVGGFGE